MEYTLHQLRVLIKVSENLSITKAAEELYLTQPAVSIQLKKLQNQFEIPLTEVIGRKLFVTDFGREIVRIAERILGEVDAIAFTTMQYKEYLAGKLKISIVSTAKYVMPYFLADFMRNHPGVELVMDVTNKAKVVQSLEKNEVDFSLVTVLPENLDLNVIQLLQNKLFLIGGAVLESGRTGSGSRIFSDYPLIFREQGSATRQAMESFLKINGIGGSKKIELTSNEAAKQAVLAGLGYSIMPLIGIKDQLNSGELSIIKYPGLPLLTDWKIVWLKSKRLSPVARAYLDYIELHTTRIIDENFSWYEKY
ncbi:MAG: DNA-binding transcriptional LysR family regulator [Litorivivens sp.]|jgi:DNA-binding transcriptional LysR family regulator